MRRLQGKTKYLLLPVMICILCLVCTGYASPLTIPGKQRTVEAAAYLGDQTLDSVILEEGIVSIGSKAFADSSLREITLPASLTSVAEDAFAGCALQTVHAEKGTYAYQWMRDKGYIAEYRALLIGERDFIWFFDEETPDDYYWAFLRERTNRNAGDVNNLTEALGYTSGPQGACGAAGDAFQVTQKINLSYTGVRNAIRDTFADTKDQDLSIFFIATHGDSDADGDLRMAFTSEDEIPDDEQLRKYWEHRYLSFETLASWLKTYAKGRVFVILESCGSGSAIYEEGVPENVLRRGAGDTQEAAESFVDRAVDAFGKADPGIPETQANREGLSGSTGDLRKSKFHVLAASRHHEVSYGWETKQEETSYNFFTRWLTEGIGTEEESPADTDGDGYLTLEEMFSYVKQFDTFTVKETTYHQHVQRYPTGSSRKLLKLKNGQAVPTPTYTPTPTPTPTPTSTAEPTVTPSPTPSPRPVPATGDGAEPGLWWMAVLLGIAGLGSVTRKRRGKQ